MTSRRARPSSGIGINRSGRAHPPVRYAGAKFGWRRVGRCDGREWRTFASERTNVFRRQTDVMPRSPSAATRYASRTGRPRNNRAAAAADRRSTYITTTKMCSSSYLFAVSLINGFIGDSDSSCTTYISTSSPKSVFIAITKIPLHKNNCFVLFFFFCYKFLGSLRFGAL